MSRTSPIRWSQWNHVTADRNARVHPPEMLPPNSLDLNLVDYSICGILEDRVYRSRIHDVLREWRLLVLDHSITAAVTAQWRSHLSTCIRVNDGHFEHEFHNFLVCCFIDTGFRKFARLWHEHVQRANNVWNVLLLCLRLFNGMVATKRMYGRKFLHQVLWHSLAKLRTKKLWKCIYICKSYSK